jgi:uncharacterized membrane protein
LADRLRRERSQHFLDKLRIRPAFGAFCCGLAVGACLARLRLARSRLRLARRSTALRRRRIGRDLMDAMPDYVPTLE